MFQNGDDKRLACSLTPNINQWAWNCMLIGSYAISQWAWDSCLSLSHPLCWRQDGDSRNTLGWRHWKSIHLYGSYPKLHQHSQQTSVVLFLAMKPYCCSLIITFHASFLPPAPLHFPNLPHLYLSIFTHELFKIILPSFQHTLHILVHFWSLYPWLPLPAAHPFQLKRSP